MTLPRRRLLQGAALAAGAPALRAEAAADPAALTGLRGQTDAMNAVAHRWRDQPALWREAVVERDEGVEDLVVVGAGLSGLTGAHLFRQQAGRPVRMLLLDPMDSPGGHAQRNEFISRSGQRLIGYGGSQSLDGPSLFSPAAAGLLKDLGLDLQRFDRECFDRDWARRQGLTNSALFFGREAWGEDRLVLRAPGEAPAQWLARTPFDAAAQAALQRLLMPGPQPHPLSRLRSVAARRALLAGTTYRRYLQQHWGLPEAALRYLQGDTQGYFGVWAPTR